MRHLTLPYGLAVVEYRALDGIPMPHQVAIQRRTLMPSGDNYRASEWVTMTVGDVRSEVRLNGPVAQWLRREARVDLSAVWLAAYSDREPAHLSLL